MKREINISNSYAKQISYILHKFERFLVTNNGSSKDLENWKKLSQQDIVSFLDSVRKPEPLDPYHEWIGTYNTYFIALLRFFKWLHYPDLQSSNRGTWNNDKSINHRLKMDWTYGLGKIYTNFIYIA
jgi:hypothetical protein